MHNTYKIAIVYFILFSILLLISALMIFSTKMGFSPLGVSDYYLGNEEKFMQAKSLSGLLKVSFPHIFSLALFAMVLLHFVYFTSHKNTKSLRYLIVLTYLTIFVELISGFVLLLGVPLFAFIKLISMVLMLLLFFIMFWMILSSILLQKDQNS